jgi:hypothetical protein
MVAWAKLEAIAQAEVLGANSLALIARWADPAHRLAPSRASHLSTGDWS